MGFSSLPRWRTVLVVGAHPDDESFGMGAVVAAFTGAGATVGVLTFTRGDASTLGGVTDDLGRIRTAELEAAARILGVTESRLLDHPDGGLAGEPLDELVDEVASFAQDLAPDGILTFDEGGITGHPDHCRATRAALLAAARHGLPVLGWAVPAPVAARLNAEFGTAFVGRDRDELDVCLTVDRSRQVRAIAEHASQSGDNPVLWRRLELLGDNEWLRRLRAVDRARMAVCHNRGRRGDDEPSGDAR